ncbi:MAG TPA: GNAT family N-acetyltransferase [Gaiellaceae bacterium]|nr:GNAT family N-acetyltransferase [Gaiellaceae bacterium]
MTVGIRRAGHDDVAFLAELLADDDVAPFLAASRVTAAEDLDALVERSEADAEAFGLFVIEVDGERAGTMQFERVNRRSQIAALSGLAVDPRFRGRGVADEAARALQQHLLFELGYHRLQLEVYGFNQRGRRHAERAGFVLEGIRRNAYRRDEEWVDGVLYGLVREDLELRPERPESDLVLTCRHVTVHVSMLEPALDFYVRGLGLELLEQGDSFFAVRAGDVRISVFSGFEQAPGERARQTGVTLILAAPDVDAAYAAVRARGVETLGGIVEAGGLLRFFSVLDPDGTLLSIAEYLEPEVLRPGP